MCAVAMKLKKIAIAPLLDGGFLCFGGDCCKCSNALRGKSREYIRSVLGINSLFYALQLQVATSVIH